MPALLWLVEKIYLRGLRDKIPQNLLHEYGRDKSYRVFRRVGVHPRVGRVLVEGEGITMTPIWSQDKSP